jgi:hypothetical protein
MRAAIDRTEGCVYYIIHWIEQRGVGTYDLGWVCV